MLSGERMTRAAALDGGGTSRRRSRSPSLRRFYVAEPLSSRGLGGDLDEDCMGREFVDLTGSSSGNARIDLVATPGRRPRYMVVLVTTRMKTAWAEGSSIMTGSLSGNTKVDLVASPGRRPWNWWCVLVAFVRLGSCGRRVGSSV